jgi:hypothetical protein
MPSFLFQHISRLIFEMVLEILLHTYTMAAELNPLPEMYLPVRDRVCVMKAPRLQITGSKIPHLSLLRRCTPRLVDDGFMVKRQQ